MAIARPGWVPLGLWSNTLAMLLFAVFGSVDAIDRVLLVLEASSVALAAWALRHWRETPSDGLAALGLGAFAVLEVVHIGVSVAGGMSGLPLVGFALYVAGALAAAGGAVWWRSSMAESGGAMHTVRIGMATLGVSYLWYVVLGLASVFVVLVSVMAALGALMVAWAFAPARIASTTSDGDAPSGAGALPRV